jgi:hypothetical protein
LHQLLGPIRVGSDVRRGAAPAIVEPAPVDGTPLSVAQSWNPKRR